jgi:hypothetical protein
MLARLACAAGDRQSGELGVRPVGPLAPHPGAGAYRPLAGAWSRLALSGPQSTAIR